MSPSGSSEATTCRRHDEEPLRRPGSLVVIAEAALRPVLSDDPGPARGFDQQPSRGRKPDQRGLGWADAGDLAHAFDECTAGRRDGGDRQRRCDRHADHRARVAFEPGLALPRLVRRRHDGPGALSRLELAGRRIE
jgi:hypothetical protein